MAIVRNSECGTIREKRTQLSSGWATIQVPAHGLLRVRREGSLVDG